MTADTRIRIALVVAGLLVLALVLFGALGTIAVPREAPKPAPVVEEDANRGSESGEKEGQGAKDEQSAVEKACEEARVKLLTTKGEDFAPFEREDLRRDIQKLCD